MQPIPSRQMLEAYRRDFMNMTSYRGPIYGEFYLQVDSLGLDEIANGTAIASASWAGAHFFVEYENDEPLSCEMTVPELDGMAELRSLTRGTRAQEAIAQIRAAQHFRKYRRATTPTLCCR